MFGMEDQQGKDLEDLPFDMETELVNPAIRKRKIQNVRDKIMTIKTLLRAGMDPKDMDSIGTLLHGYIALQSVIDSTK